jgi:predicted DNA-binding transcriptional regulator AlpA
MATATAVSPEYLRLNQAAQFISMSPAYLRKVCRLGKGPTKIRLGKSPVFHVEELRRWVQAHVERKAV